MREVLERIEALEHIGFSPVIYPDAEDFIQRRLIGERLSRRCAEIRADPAKHPLRNELLSATLLPYQLDGIAFAVSADTIEEQLLNTLASKQELADAALDAGSGIDRRTEQLGKSMELDEKGRPQLKITLPDRDALQGLATTLAKLLGSAGDGAG